MITQPPPIAPTPILPIPAMREIAIAAMIVAALAGLHVVGLWREGRRLSSTPFIDPAGVIQVTAWDFYNRQRLSEGEFPLWNPYTGFGQPHLANLQTAVFYPLKLPFYIIGGLTGHDIYLYLRLVLLGLGPFVLLRSLGIGKHGAIFGAVSFGLGSYALWFVNLVELNNQIVTPFLMIALARLTGGFTMKRLLASAALVFVDFLGGHPEGIFVTILFSGLFAIHMSGWKNAPASFAKLLPAGIIGFLGATIVMIPFAEYFPRAWNLHFPGLGFLHLGALAPITTISPFLKGMINIPMWQIPPDALNMSTWDFFKMPYNHFRYNWGLPSLGVIATSMALYGTYYHRKLPRGSGFFAVFWLCAVMFAMGLPPMKLLSFLPPFNVTNNAKFYFAEIALASSLLAGIGLDYWIKVGGKKPLAIAAVLSIIAVALSYGFSLEAPDIFIQLLPVAILAVASTSKKYIIGVAAIILLVLELSVMRIAVKPYIPIDWNKSLSAAWLKEMPAGPSAWLMGRFQVQDDFLFTPNLNLVNMTADVRSSDAMFPKSYFNELAEMGGLDEDGAMRDFYPRYITKLNDKALQSPKLSDIGVRYIISSKKMPELNMPEKIVDSVYIYENNNLKPVEYLFGKNATLVAADEEYLKIKKGKFYGNFYNTNIFNYPGWSKPRMSGFVFNIDDHFTKETLSFTFKPNSFKIGLWLSLATALAFAIIFYSIRRKHEQTTI